MMIDAPILFKTFSAPFAWGSSRLAAVQAPFKLSEYSGTRLSTVTATVEEVSSTPPFAGASGAGPLSDVSLREENLLNNFGIGIESGEKREGCQDREIQSIQDIHRWHFLTPDGIGSQLGRRPSRSSVHSSTLIACCCRTWKCRSSRTRGVIRRKFGHGGELGEVLPVHEGFQEYVWFGMEVGGVASTYLLPIVTINPCRCSVYGFLVSDGESILTLWGLESGVWMMRNDSVKYSPRGWSRDHRTGSARSGDRR